MELIQGENLQAMLERRQRRLSVSEALRYAVQIAAIVSKVHAAGWVWRDCKPANLIISKGRELKPVDFEGACPVECDDTVALEHLGVRATRMAAQSVCKFETAWGLLCPWVGCVFFF